MSVNRYVLIVLIGNIIAVAILVLALHDDYVAPGWEWRSPVAIVGIASLMTMHAYRYAKRVEPEEQTGFLAYRVSNAVLAAFWAIMLIALAYVLIVPA